MLSTCALCKTLHCVDTLSMLTWNLPACLPLLAALVALEPATRHRRTPCGLYTAGSLPLPRLTISAAFPLRAQRCMTAASAWTGSRSAQQVHKSGRAEPHQASSCAMLSGVVHVLISAETPNILLRVQQCMTGVSAAHKHNSAQQVAVMGFWSGA